jgi:glycosyltransferase involved in cell wall biosynthesis
MAQGALHVVLVCQGDLGGASEKQALGFAEQLTARGHRVLLSLRGDPATVTREGADRVNALATRFHSFRGPRLSPADLDAARAFGPSLVHAFNPRVGTLMAARSYASATGAPLFVHWEDDEWSIRSGYGRRSLPRRVARLGRRVLAPIAPCQGIFVNRRALRWAAEAAGNDALTPALAERVEQHLGRECAVVFPITPATNSAPADPPELPASLEGHALVGLTGEVHPGSVDDLALALWAIADVQRRGKKVALVHAGKALPRFDLDEIARAAGVQPGTAVFLGYRPFAEIPPLLRTLDILIQPGRPNEFNRLRLPSKMQAYLQSGTPTITFAVGFGELLEDRDEVLKLHGFDVRELADRIDDVLSDPALAQRLAGGGPRAAARLLDPARNAEALIAHYRNCLERA